MTEAVSLRAVVDELTALGEDWTPYLNKETGELFTLTAEDHDALEDLDEDLIPASRQEELPKLREVVESGDWLELPDRVALDDHGIIERFCLSIEDGRQRDQLREAISGTTTARTFKATAGSFGLTDDWSRFRDQAYAEIAIDWLEAHDIPYTKDM